jgi:hypothetical protein
MASVRLASADVKANDRRMLATRVRSSSLSSLVGRRAEIGSRSLNERFHYDVEYTVHGAGDLRGCTITGIGTMIRIVGGSSAKTRSGCKADSMRSFTHPIQ